MDTGLGWLGAVVGLAGCIATFFMSSSPPGGNGKARSSAGLTFILTIIFWAIAMQRNAPFSTGQTLGWGLLIGGLCGTAAILLSGRLGEQRPLALQSVLFLALFGASLTYLIFHGYPQQAMIGFAIGTVLAGILGYYSLESADLIQSWALFGVALAAGVVLAVEHFNQAAERAWWPLPILIGTTVLVAAFAVNALGDKLRRASAIVVPALVIILSALYAWRIYHAWELLEVVAVGIVVAALVRWLDAYKPSPGVSALLVVAFVTAAFKLWAGLGIAVGLLAMWSFEQKRSTQGIISLGLAFLLFKLFTDQYASAVRATDLSIHYALIGAALGIIVPYLLISALNGRRSMVLIALIGFAMAISPIVLYFVWETKAVFGYLFGLTASLIVQMLMGEERRSVGLLVVGAQLMAIQFMSTLLPLELTRVTRVWVLGIVVVAGAIALMFVPSQAGAVSSSAEAAADKGG